MALRLGAVVLDCPDPAALAEFYAAVLGRQVAPHDAGGGWVDVPDPEGGPSVSFQLDPAFRPPTWPEGERPQMLHLDIVVTDLDAEHERVVGLGARLVDDTHATFRVYLDPAGHPFCLCAC
ncbi:MAG TPA: VOC family protein [Pseudonocardiaceae bacterium]